MATSTNIDWFLMSLFGYPQDLFAAPGRCKKNTGSGKGAASLTSNLAASGLLC
jgi:hypothetical protein